MCEQLQRSQCLAHTDTGVRGQGQDLFEFGELNQRVSGEADAQLNRVERGDLAAPRLDAALARVLQRPGYPA